MQKIEQKEKSNEKIRKGKITGKTVWETPAW